MLTGTAPVSKPGLSNDSLAVARQFVHNVRPILDSLTALHFARTRIGLLEIRLKRTEDQRDQLAVEYAKARQDATKMAFDLFDTKEQLGRYRQKRRGDQVEKWLLRLAAAYLAYKKICPSCPP